MWEVVVAAHDLSSTVLAGKGDDHISAQIIPSYAWIKSRSPKINVLVSSSFFLNYSISCRRPTRKTLTLGVPSALHRSCWWDSPSLPEPGIPRRVDHSTALASRSMLLVLDGHRLRRGYNAENSPIQNCGYLGLQTSGISHVSLRRHSGSQVEPSFNSLAKGLALCRNNEEGRNKAVMFWVTTFVNGNLRA